MKLRSGGVLPSSIMGIDKHSAIGGFEKTYKNFALRSGIVIRSYGIDSDDNNSKLVPEYDVVVMEQDANRGITPITYKNCISASSFGSIADYFEVRLRSQKKNKNKFSKGRDFNDQDGAAVLLLCLDGSSEKAVIVGALPHPNRKSKLVGNKKILAGEFNGVALSVADDGSANLTFKGATDSEGTPVDKEQGNTSVDIEKDGTLRLKHKGAELAVEKSGNFILTNEGNTAIVSKKDISGSSDANISLSSKKDTTLSMDKFVLEAMGSASLSAQSFKITGETTIDLQAQMIKISGDAEIKAKASMITLEGLVFLGGPGGQPLVLPNTQMVGTGNQGLPVISTAIGPFATKAFAT